MAQQCLTDQKNANYIFDIPDNFLSPLFPRPPPNLETPQPLSEDRGAPPTARGGGVCVPTSEASRNKPQLAASESVCAHAAGV